jgi:hypothetical protein
LETKEQFSDGVGYGWIDTLKATVAVEISDEQLANAKYKFPLKRVRDLWLKCAYKKSERMGWKPNMSQFALTA